MAWSFSLTSWEASSESGSAARSMTSTETIRPYGGSASPSGPCRRSYICRSAKPRSGTVRRPSPDPFSVSEISWGSGGETPSRSTREAGRNPSGVLHGVEDVSRHHQVQMRTAAVLEQRDLIVGLPHEGARPQIIVIRHDIAFEKHPVRDRDLQLADMAHRRLAAVHEHPRPAQRGVIRLAHVG